MKKHLLLFFALFFCADAVCLAQNRIDGLGPFKIGKTTISDITNMFAGDTGTVPVSIDVINFMEVRSGRKPLGLYRLAQGDSLKFNDELHYTDDIAIFCLPVYTVAEIRLEKLILTFLHNKLVIIAPSEYGIPGSEYASGTDELIEALAIKYGKSTKSTITKDGCYFFTYAWRGSTVTAGILPNYCARDNSGVCTPFKIYKNGIFSILKQLNQSAFNRKHAAYAAKLRQSRLKKL